MIPISEIPISICAAWDYWSIILYFRSPLFASGGPLLSIRPPLLLSPVALNTFVALWLSLAQTFDPPGARLCGPLAFRSTLAWAFTFQVCACMDLRPPGSRKRGPLPSGSYLRGPDPPGPHHSSAKKIPPHVLHTYLPVPSSNSTSPHPSYPSCSHIMF